jgi:Na+/H+ antiporter NhaD/arsenite permease-like protein
MSSKLLYATIGVLFVNVSIGGTLTHFAAPPVLMVAATWNWDTPFMLTNFGWKSALAVAINGAAVSYWFRKELVAASRASLASADDAPSIPPVPGSFIALHLLLIASIVFFAHHPAIFLGILLIFLAIAAAYPEHQDRLILREGLLVGFFLAGLVIIGGMQAWWLQPLLTQMSPSAVFFGAAGLTAFTDNAALTYLGSLVQGLSDEFKYALVAGAVAGGGLTVIANAPNPAGATLLKVRFEGQIIQPMGLLLGALLPTAVAIACLKYL